MCRIKKSIVSLLFFFIAFVPQLYAQDADSTNFSIYYSRGCRQTISLHPIVKRLLELRRNGVNIDLQFESYLKTRKSDCFESFPLHSLKYYYKKYSGIVIGIIPAGEKNQEGYKYCPSGKNDKHTSVKKFG